MHGVHSFTNEVIAEKYLAAEASYEHPAEYYYSCKCGEHGAATFTYGDPLQPDLSDESEIEPNVESENEIVTNVESESETDYESEVESSSNSKEESTPNTDDSQEESQTQDSNFEEVATKVLEVVIDILCPIIPLVRWIISWFK